MAKRLKSNKAVSKKYDPEDKLLPRLTMFFFRRSGTAALIWLVIAVLGIASYTSLLKREGFPSVNIPVVVVNGAYAVDNAQKVDMALAKPISDIALKQKGVSSVTSTSDANFFSVSIQYKDSIDSQQAKTTLKKDVERSEVVPQNTDIRFDAPYFGATGGSIDKVDATISVYDSSHKQTLPQLVDSANEIAKSINNKKLTQVKNAKVVDPFKEVADPFTGQTHTLQRTFDRFGVRENDQNNFYQSVTINISAVDEFDALKLDSSLQSAIDAINSSKKFSDTKLAIGASNAPAVEESISELQRVLLEGLLAVLIVGSIVIAIRASMIIVLAMITVLLATLALLFLTGHTLNVITLFGLILSLSLIVDDTIIMTEAIDAARRRNKKASTAVKQATRKISRAMVAATLTAALSFAPLIFVSGILGTFIRTVPITIISALLISLFTALIIIPLFAKYLLLGKKQMGEGNITEIAAGIEGKIATWLTKPMTWARNSRKHEFAVGISAIIISLIFIMGGGLIFKQYVDFNIFPPTKDTNRIAVGITFPSGTNINQAEQITDEANAITKKIIGEQFIKGSYYGMANDQSSLLYVSLVPYGERNIKSPEIIDQLNKQFKDFSQAKVEARTIDVGPPPSSFIVNIDASSNREGSVRLAKDMASYLEGLTLKRTNGTTAKIVDASTGNTSSVNRNEGNLIIQVEARFADSDTSTLTMLAKDAVQTKFSPEVLASYGLPSDAIGFDLGQESENQKSFSSLAYAFPLVLLIIFVLLAVQFRSLLQPLVIFMAIPFSFFGIALGLAVSDNPFSFFTMLGFFALIGLSIKNTILLVDYANQSRRAGADPVDAAVEALEERFRPLVATSLTAIVSLIPLAITSPFWQSLAIVLIFGLLSSTLLVVTVFPYYYLGGEYLRLHINRRTGGAWVVTSLAIAVTLGQINPVSAILAPFIGVFTVIIIKKKFKLLG